GVVGGEFVAQRLVRHRHDDAGLAAHAAGRVQARLDDLVDVLPAGHVRLELADDPPRFDGLKNFDHSAYLLLVSDGALPLSALYHAFPSFARAGRRVDGPGADESHARGSAASGLADGDGGEGRKAEEMSGIFGAGEVRLGPRGGRGAVRGCGAGDA